MNLYIFENGKELDIFYNIIFVMILQIIQFLSLFIFIKYYVVQVRLVYECYGKVKLLIYSGFLSLNVEKLYGKYL